VRNAISGDGTFFPAWVRVREVFVLAQRHGTRAIKRMMAPARVEGRWAAALVAAGAVAAAALAIGLTRGLTFYLDDWVFVVQRQGDDLDTLLRPYPEHVVFLPLLVYKALFQLVGLAHYSPYQGVVIALHLLCAVLVFLIARRRMGDALAPIPALVLLFLGPGWQNILWPFQIGFLMPLAAGLGALLALDRGDVKGDLFAGGLLLVSFASGSVAAPITLGVGVELLLGRDRLRRLARVVAVPVGVYGVWLLVYGDQVARYHNGAARFAKAFGIHTPSLWSVPGVAVDKASAALAAGFSLDPGWGWLPASALAIAIVARFVRNPADSKRLVALVVMTGAYWSLVAEFRPLFVSPPSRYIYLGTVFVLLIAIELLRGVQIRWAGLALAYGLAAVVIVSNVAALQRGADELRQNSAFVAPGLGALELAGKKVDPAFRPFPDLAIYILAGKYFSAVAKFGSPALPAQQIPKLPEDVRRSSDAILVSALRPRLQAGTMPAQPGAPPTVLPSQSVGAHASRGCVVLVPRSRGASVELGFVAPGLALRAAKGAPIQVRLRRFADSYDPPSTKGFANVLYGFVRSPVLVLPAGAVRLLKLPADRLTRPWHMQLLASQPVVACGLPRA
jgi:hypothetical protein